MTGIEGDAPAGSTLTIRKSFDTQTSRIWNDDFGTSIGDPIVFGDTLQYSMVTGGPAFEWNVNPSTRPVVAGRDGRDAVNVSRLEDDERLRAVPLRGA